MTTKKPPDSADFLDGAANPPEAPKRRGMGRESKLTKKLIKEFVAVLSTSSTPIATMAEAAGIGKTTFFRWMAGGEAATSGLQRDLWVAVTKARAAGTADTLAKMRALALETKDWRGMAWELERTRPKEFGLRVRVHVEEELATLWKLLKSEFANEPAIWERIARVIAGEVSPEESDPPEP